MTIEQQIAALTTATTNLLDVVNVKKATLDAAVSDASEAAIATAADRVQTGLDAAATAADRIQTGLDRTQTGEDRIATAADRVQTGLDAAAASASASTAAISEINAANSASASATSANNSAGSAVQAATQAAAADSSAVAANMSAGEAAGSAAQALAIYSNTDAMNTALASAQNAASLAAGHAASASSVVQQDLSGVDTAALHRSPNAITAMFVYDTSKDSDGGAWTEKCQHTSWYNEEINGKWLGARYSEVDARQALSSKPELIPNGEFSLNTEGWSAQSGNVISVDAGQLKITRTASTYGGAVSNTIPLEIGKTYIFTLRRNGGTYRIRKSQFASYTNDNQTNNVAVFTADTNSCFIEFGSLSNSSAITLFFDGASLRELDTSGATTGDYFQLTTDGKFYKLNATSGITEVFRGNKRDFPRLAGIVADAMSVTIYDLTEQGRPMWRVIRPSNLVGSFRDVWRGNRTPSSIAALNGKVFFGQVQGTSAPLGLSMYDFALDMAGKYSSIAAESGVVPLALALTTPIAPASLPTIVNSTVNAVAMTVLPDAPVDPVTGLKVPTIAAATGGGVSVIKHNGTAVNSSLTWSFTQVRLTPNLLVVSVNNASSFRYAVSPGQLGSSFALTTPATMLETVIGRTNSITASGRGVFFQNNIDTGYPMRVRGVRLCESNSQASTSFSVANTYNTGHQPGDIRRTYLSDIGAGNVTGPELVTNGTFDTNLDGWVSNGSFPSTATWSNGKMLVSSIGSYSSQVTLIPTVPGRLYKITSNSVGGFISVGFASSTSTGFNTHNHVYFVAKYTQTAIVACALSATAEFDNISVREVVADRSYKAQGASITGTLTKSAVASNTQLVAYSGFSAANYLREPYSADLDFGTGEWSVGAWVNTTSPARGGNLFVYSEEVNRWNADKCTITADAIAAPDGTTTADLAVVNNGVLIGNGASSDGMVWPQIGSAALNFNGGATVSYFFKKHLNRYAIISTSAYGGWAALDLDTGAVAYNSWHVWFGTVTTNVISLPDGWYRFSVNFAPLNTQGNVLGARYFATSQSVANARGTGDGTSGVYIWGAQLEVSTTAVPGAYIKTVASPAPVVAPIFDRAFSSGPVLRGGIDSYGRLTATAFDGTTTRTVTTASAYNTGTWNKVRANYTTDGTLSIVVNGVEVGATRGNPLLTLNNPDAVLTIGNSYALDAPFPGSIALLKLSATVPTAEQSVWMYEQEKQLFRDGAQCCLPDATAILDMSYDEATDRWIAVSESNESEWSGLVRTNVKAVPAGKYTKLASGGGVKLEARSTTNPGVDITMPAYRLRSELVRRAEAAARMNAQLTTFDYVGGFTASTTSGSTSITSVAGLSYPTRYVGAQVSGAGIPAGTVVSAVSGTTLYLSKAATATATGVQISFTDFVLPMGHEAKTVMVAGAVKQEGATKDFTRLFDGFKETVRFAVAPAYNAWVQVQTTRSAA